MHISQIVSYGLAWNDLVESFPNELADIRVAVERLTPENIAASPALRSFGIQSDPGINRFRVDGCWTSAIQSRGWSESDAVIKGGGTRAIQMRPLGYAKNRVAVSFQRHREMLNRWLFTLAPLGVRNGYIDIPIAVALSQRTEQQIYGKKSPIVHGVVERTTEELLALSPLSHGHPFLLISLSLDKQDAQFIELEAEEDGINRQIVINRSIEFPPEYHQAGLGILNYFGTVLREKYPEHQATVRIEQEGLRVRLIIESPNGDRDVIEKALQEYELVVSGEAAPEQFFESKAKVLELKNELRIFQVRVESQRDLISLQGEEIQNLRQIIGHSLTNRPPIHVEVSPRISVNTSQLTQVSQSVPALSAHIQDLVALASADPEMEMRLLDLEEALAALSTKTSAEAVKESGALKKLRKFLGEANEVGSAAHTFLSKVGDGVDLLQQVARRYNDIAQWCGAPQVPSVLLGKV